MVDYHNKPVLPPYLKNVPGKPVDMSRRLKFEPVQADFVSKHTGGKPVAVTRVYDTPYGAEWALLFRTPLNEDLDGAPTSYAPPTSATNTSPTGTQHPLDNIKNATNQKGIVFHDDATKNTYLWTGVVSARPADAGGRHLDDRPFLHDALGRVPVFQPAASATSDFYAPQTAMNAIDGQAVNPLVVPYAALSNSMAVHGHVGLGDFGLAIRASTGAATGFLYGDAGGGASTSVGECSRAMIRALFGGPATSEDICYVVFPGTSAGSMANAALIVPKVRDLLHKLAAFPNTEDLAKKLLMPWLLDDAAAIEFARDLAASRWPSGGIPQPNRGIRPIVDGLDDPVAPNFQAMPEFRTIMAALRTAGLQA
jgi:Fungal chitosanase of glycosyl hydrolase group 75